jgi:excisionase family DNA binding protein
MKGTFFMQATAENNISQSFYTVKDVQRFLNIGRNSAYKLVAEKDFPSIYVGNRIVIPADLFHSWVSNQATGRKGVGINGKYPQG